jgi:hypothetical protein
MSYTTADYSREVREWELDHPRIAYYWKSKYGKRIKVYV